MAEFTKEQLIEKLERRLAVTTHYPDFEEAQLDAQIFKIALEALTAGMEQEPVAWLLSGGGAKNNVSFDSGNAYADPLREVTPLYTAPPAPVSVPAAMEIDDDFDSAFEHGKAVGWNAYRAAMLQSFGNSEQLNSPVIPDGWADMLQRWLVFGRGMQNAGSQLPLNLIAETEAMLAAAPQQEAKNV